MSFVDLKDRINAVCRNCHLTPAINGGFSYQDAYRGSEILVDGQRRFVPGLYDAGDRMATAMLSGRMPPPEIRALDPDFYQNLALLFKAWVDAARPDRDFNVPPSSGPAGNMKPPLEVAEKMTNIGDCIPKAAVIGSDPERDRFFASAQALPDDLGATDMFTLDAYELAKRGTAAFAPTYQLWADEARKLRLVHPPAGQKIEFDQANKKFRIPENTRFYKTFFKPVREADGQVRYRKVETRLIVSRQPWERSLFGAYLWNETEDRATLIKAPYRNGQPFKDTVFSVEVDQVAGISRRYAVPAKHRCIECHQGSEGENFILGFTPLQINRRPLGEGGIYEASDADELNQVDRLIAYGIIGGLTDRSALPKLEELGRNRPRNQYELRAQAYAVGNCYHCHNPLGFASQQERRLISFNLSPGSMFQFPPATLGVSSGRLLVTPGNASTSELYRRVLNPTSLLGIVAIQHMPLHTPGRDCRAADIMGRWITSIPANPGDPQSVADAEERASRFSSGCMPPREVDWLEEDFTEPPSYTPRRQDWNDPVNGITPWIRALEFTATLQQMARTPVAVGYWNVRAECEFPTVSEPAGGIRPWMVDSMGNPRRPYGQIFYQTAGSYYFTAVCSRCHGPRADGSSGLAKLLAEQTGGTIRVANFMDGLFGHGGDNLHTFDVVDAGGPRNLGGNYLIWMASGATRVQFPPGFGDLVGPFGANMLNRVREEYKRLLPGHRQPLQVDTQPFEIYQAVATHENPITPETGFTPDGAPIDVERQNAWLDRAQTNAGWMLFRFLRDEAARGEWPLTPNDCDQRFPRR